MKVHIFVQSIPPYRDAGIGDLGMTTKTKKYQMRGASVVEPTKNAPLPMTTGKGLQQLYPCGRIETALGRTLGVGTIPPKSRPKLAWNLT